MTVSRISEQTHLKRREEEDRQNLLGSLPYKVCLTKPNFAANSCCQLKIKNSLSIFHSPKSKLDGYMDAYRKESQSLGRSQQTLASMLERGAGLMGQLQAQGDTIKSVHRKVLDVANVLGLSQATIRVIERRISGDRIIVFGGIALTLLVLFFVLYTAKKLPF
eukprot:c11741_g1_i1.p1 GENE.c11741_g1_i1~~c11741_g1_i1.p1  ORF type:complete len:163 (-),score=36.14 c11741_g1_i1:165-653(-)